MRDWRAHWNQIDVSAPRSDTETLRQVGKTVLGRPVDGRHVETIVDTIVDALDLTAEDQVVDLGCGNGLLTTRIATRVAQVLGIDVSQPLLAAAHEATHATNVRYAFGDLGKLGEVQIGTPTKAYCYEVLQHLSTDDTRSLLTTLIGHFADGLVLFVGSVPDRDRIRDFYDTEERWRHHLAAEQNGGDQIGHWWSKGELAEIGASLGLVCEFTDQASHLYTSHYRFDATVRRP